MTQKSDVSYERCCRVCAEEQDVTIMILSQEAEAMLLQNKLSRYLSVEVEENDKLPKNICIQCCIKLRTMCDFTDTSRKVQEVFRNRSSVLDQNIPNDCMSSLVKNDVKPETENSVIDKYTEMQVSVDPMMVLQNSEDIHVNAYDGGSSMEDVLYLHGLDGENVTIKRIKKGDTPSVCDDEQERPVSSSLVSVDIGDDEKKDSDVKTFECDTCKQTFSREFIFKAKVSDLVSEMDIEKRFTCSTCSGYLKYNYDLKSLLKPYINNGLCKLCGRMFRLEKTYLAHMAVHLSSNKSYTCKTCGRSYKTWGGLKTHNVTHSNERPYRCSYCEKTFKRNQDLKFHINQHTGAKPYKCPFCEKGFASSGNCYSHKIRMHSGEIPKDRVRRRNLPPKENPRFQPVANEPGNPVYINGIVKYQCEICEHSFMKKENYHCHMYQHTGEKPFGCSICSEKFLTRRGLLIHHDNRHPGKNRPLALISKNVLLK